MDAGVAASPWTELDEAGTGLTVNDFLTTILSQIGSALRRGVTLPYAERFDLTVPEWRLLSLLAHADRMPFSELVQLSTSDKALVSRTLRTLDRRRLVQLDNAGNTPRKRLYCTITQAGRDLHAQIIPLARREQAAVLRVLSSEEREALYRTLRKLHTYCVLGGEQRDGGGSEDGDEDGDDGRE